MKKVLIVGASGATGKLLVQQLLQKDIESLLAGEMDRRVSLLEH